MTATYTFDVFSSLDGFGAASGNWTGYWASKAPSSSTTASPCTTRSSGWSSGQHVSGVRADAGLEHRGSEVRDHGSPG
jgi:hypothetical protein